MKKSILVWVVFSMSVFAGVWSEPVLVGRDVGIYPTIDNQGVCWLPCGRSTYKFDEETSSWQKVTESDFYGSSACFDKGDTLWVFNGNQDQIYYVRYYGGNWSDLDTVRAFPGGNSPPRVAADSAGGVWACWLWWWDALACNRYKDGQWGEPQLVPDTVPGQDWGMSITTDALGRVWVGWYTLGVDGNSLECRYNDGGVWSEQMSILGVNLLYDESLELAPDRQGGIWAVWSVSRHEWQDPSFVEARHYKDGVWGDIDTVANAGIFSDPLYTPMPAIAVDAYGRAWAVWRQALVPQDGYCDIYYSFNAGLGWSTPAPVDTDPAVDHLPDIAVDGAGRVWCVWSSSRGDSTGVWASYATGAGIEDPVTHNYHTPGLDVESFTANPKVFYSLPAGQSGTISIYDVAGKRVESRKVQNSGEVRFPSNLPSGVYFVRMHSDEFEASERVVLLK